MKAPLLARQVEQMEQRALVEAAFGEIFQHQRAGGERDRHIGAIERTRRPECRAPAARAQIAARWLLPEPSGPTQQHGALRPVRPAFDQRQRGGIGRPRQEILARAWLSAWSSARASWVGSGSLTRCLR